MIVLRVSGDTNVKVLAEAIERQVHKNGSIEVHAAGEKAVNRAVKGIAIANNFIKCRNASLIATPFFKMVKVAGKELTIINFVVGKEKF